MAEKPRSPNYPGFGLTEAILKAKQLFDHDGKSAVPRDVAVQAWGYKGRNGASLRALGALRQFGLLEMPTSGSVRLSADALVLILEPDGSTDRRAALSSVAMRPTIFRQLAKQYPEGLPSDAAVISHLVRTENFTEDSARAVIASYRDTLALVGPVSASNTPSSNGTNIGDDDDEEEDERRKPDQKPKKEGQMPESGRESIDFPFPIISGGQAVLRMPRTMTARDYTMLTTMIESVLKGMKDALVAEPPATSPDD